MGTCVPLLQKLGHCRELPDSHTLTEHSALEEGVSPPWARAELDTTTTDRLQVHLGTCPQGTAWEELWPIGGGAAGASKGTAGGDAAPGSTAFCKRCKASDNHIAQGCTRESGQISQHLQARLPWLLPETGPAGLQSLRFPALSLYHLLYASGIGPGKQLNPNLGSRLWMLLVREVAAWSSWVSRASIPAALQTCTTRTEKQTVGLVLLARCLCQSPHLRFKTKIEHKV